MLTQSFFRYFNNKKAFNFKRKGNKKSSIKKFRRMGDKVIE